MGVYALSKISSPTTYGTTRPPADSKGVGFRFFPFVFLRSVRLKKATQFPLLLGICYHDQKFDFCIRRIAKVPEITKAFQLLGADRHHYSSNIPGSLGGQRPNEDIWPTRLFIRQKSGCSRRHVSEAPCFLRQ